MLVIKLGGSAGLNYDAFLDDLALVKEPVVFVHGGNAELDRISRLLGIEPLHVTSSTGQSSRFTDRATLEAMMMVYRGKINLTLVEGLQRRGVNAVGLSGVDGRLATGRRKSAIRAIVDGKPKMLRGDYAGSIEEIDTKLLRLLLDAGYLPVVTPPALSGEGEAINVDGDKLALRLALALQADALVLLSNTSGLLRDLDDPATRVSEIDASNDASVEAAMETAGGRMKKKVQSAIDAVRAGIPLVVMGDARAEQPVSRALAGEGTLVRGQGMEVVE